MTRLIIAIIGFVLAGAIFFLYTQPTYDQTQQISGQISEYNSALDKASELQQLKQQLLSRYNAFNPDDLNRLQKLLPDHVDNIRLILDMDGMASTYGMTLANVDISGNSSSQQTGVQPTVATIGASTQKYDALTIHFSVDSTYQDFLKFLNDLQTSLRIVDIVNLQIASAGNTRIPIGGTTPEPVYHFGLALKTYWLK